MDTKTFLKTILPERGVKFIARIRPRSGKKDATIHYAVDTAEEAAEKALELDLQYPNDNIYFAMASYKEVKTKVMTMADGRDFEFIVGRTQDNVQNVKSLWQDWDVGKADTGMSYETRDDALAAIKIYLAETGLPTPLVVSSGYGIHTYWVFTDEIPAKEWDRIASMQRVIMRHLKIKFDPSRDKDSASILRPAGTRNKKAGKEPKIVKVVRGEVNALPAMEYKRRLTAFIEAHNLGVQTKPDTPDTPDWAKTTGNLTTAEVEYPDSYAEIAVEHCQQLQEFRSNGGTSEPIWYAHIGLMKHFKDGRHHAHLWGRAYEGYDAEETELKLDQWKVGPTTCARFKELNIDTCKGCKMTCKSPVQLGLDGSVEKPNLIQIAAEAVDTASSTAHALADSGANSLDDGVPLGWPEGYGYDKKGDRVTVRVLDANGVWQQVKIATPLFYPVEQIRDEEGTFCFRMHVWVRGKVREFLLPTKYTADYRGLKMQLAGQQIHVTNDKAAADYLSNYMVNMQRQQEETDTYRQMGWKHDFKGWLIGDTLITAKEAKRVVLSKAFSTDRRGLYEPKGDPEKWKQAVNTLFNREHGEPYQFAICAAFAAPLHDLLGFSEWRGIPFALTTNESGFGKTTVNMIANSIWYDPEKGKISNSTAKAVLGIASEFNNLPFLLDEVTSYLKDPQDMGDLLYAMSNGRGREGMGQGGKLRDNSPPWTGACAMTGNRNILMQVSENKLNPEAMQMRVFEIDLDTYPRISTMVKGSDDYCELNEEHRLIAQTLVTENSGVIGTEYIRFIMKNLDDVRTKLRKVSVGLSKFMDDGDATKERFYYHLITTVLVGGYYAKRLGYIDFDLNKLRDWCVEHVNRLRGVVKDTRRTPQDLFAAMMSDFVGRIIITKHFDSLSARKNQSEMHMGAPLRTGVCGRYALGDEKEPAKLYITCSSVQQWCVEHGIPYNNLARDLLLERIVKLRHPKVNKKTGAVRIAIGKGVADLHTLGTAWCLEFDVDMAAGILPVAPPADVVEMKKAG